MLLLFFFSSRRRHTRFDCDWSSDVCSSDLHDLGTAPGPLCQAPGHDRPPVRRRGPPSVALHRTRLATLDRKSTRLNSSHSQISYAVFCLKKKKKTRSTSYNHQERLTRCHRA